MNTYDDTSRETPDFEENDDLRQRAHDTATQLVNEAFSSLSALSAEPRDAARAGYTIEADGSIVVSEDEQKAEQIVGTRGPADAKPPKTGGDTNSIHGAIKDISDKPGHKLGGNLQRNEEPANQPPIVPKGPVNSTSQQVKEK